MRFSLAFTAALSLLWSGVAPASVGPMENASAILEKATPALVTVRYVLEQEGAEFGGFTQRSHLSGAGFLVSPEGLVVLGGEILPEEEQTLQQPMRLVDFEVIGSDGEVHQADLTGWDEKANLAFVKIRSAGPFPWLDMQAAEAPEVGDVLLALGRLAEGFGGTPHLKPVWVAGRTKSGLLILDQILDLRFLGGPLFTPAGKPAGLVGIQPMGPGVDPQQESEYFPTFVATVPRGKRFGLPVGIPAALLRDSMQDPQPVPDPGRREKSWIGITLQSVSRDLAEFWEMPVETGVAVTSVIEGSPGAEAGLQVGDVIVSFDGKPVKAEKESDLDGFIRNVQKTGVGKPVEMEVFRRGRIHRKELSLGRAPMPMRTAPSYTSRDFGMKVRDLTFDFLQRTNLPRDLRGVMVEELEQGGWARVGGLREGDVIRAVQRWEIGSVEEIRRAFDRIREEKIREVVFFLQRGADTVFVSVRTDY